MTKRTTIETLSNDIRNALFVARDTAKANELIAKAEVLVKAVGNKHNRSLWTTTVEGWKMEAARA